jgi:hypothetical protein
MIIVSSKFTNFKSTNSEITEYYAGVEPLNASVYFNPPLPVQIEAVMNDFIQLEPHSNLFEVETMMEG